MKVGDFQGNYAHYRGYVLALERIKPLGNIEYEAKAGILTHGKSLTRYDYLSFVSWGVTEKEAVNEVKSKIDEYLDYA